MKYQRRVDLSEMKVNEHLFFHVYIELNIRKYTRNMKQINQSEVERKFCTNPPQNLTRFINLFKKIKQKKKQKKSQFQLKVKIGGDLQTQIQMFQGGVTDINTAKSVARKLYIQYCNASQMERSATQRMLVDTYRMMNKNYQPTSNDLDLYNRILDFNHDGRVTIDDFESLAVKYLAKTQKKNYTKNVRERLQVAKRLFQKFDKDKSGYLSQAQIPELIREAYLMMGTNYNPTREDIDSWMAMADLDGDGKVNLQDYERLIIASLQKCGIKIYERE